MTDHVAELTCPACAVSVLGQINDELVPGPAVCMQCRAVLTTDSKPDPDYDDRLMGYDENMEVREVARFPDPDGPKVFVLRYPTWPEEIRWLKMPEVKAAVKRAADYHAEFGPPMRRRFDDGGE